METKRLEKEIAICEYVGLIQIGSPLEFSICLDKQVISHCKDLSKHSELDKAIINFHLFVGKQMIEEEFIRSKFNYSYDWLMRIVNIIQIESGQEFSINYNEKSENTYTASCKYFVHTSSLKNKRFKAKGNTHIDVIYDCVSQYCQYSNEFKNK
jgi:hypothetical protein